ncbi:MAG: hypothetical protein K8I60_10675, partial [Anaerolineae bacterium]|nr:hypothetical protein [Anaerolineae bacterium]
MILAFQMVQKPEDIPGVIVFLTIFVYGILPIVSVIGGIVLDRIVGRASPIVNPISAAALIAVMVSAAVLLVLIGPVFP